MIIVERLHPDAKLPTRSTPESVGLDLYAFLLTEGGRPNTALIPPRQTKMIPTRIKVQPPEGFYFMIHSRSGLAKNNVFTTTGTIDPDYRGEIQVLLYNGGYESHYVRHEDRIAQLVLHPVCFEDIKDHMVNETIRGEKGFGSSGR
jgi:dUTP pyrophosphatase